MTQTPKSAALQFHGWGANITVMAKASKQPIHKWKRFYDTPQTLKDVEELPWRNAVGVGVLNGLGNWRTFDIDARKKDAQGNLLAVVEPVPRDVIAAVVTALGLPASYPWVWRSGSGKGWEIAFQCSDDLPAGVLSAKSKEPGVFWGVPKDKDNPAFDHIELRWDRCQTIYPPSQHEDPTNPGYCWDGVAPDAPPSVVSVGHVLTAFFVVAMNKPVDASPKPERVKRERTVNDTSKHDDAAKEEIRRRFDLVKYAVAKFGGESVKDRNGEVRITGHGGLLIREDDDVWHTFQDEVGGDCFDLAGKHLFDGRWNRRDGRMFMDALKEAAAYTGVTLPEPEKPTKKTSGHDDATGRRYLTEDEIDLLNPPTWLIKNVVPVGEVTMVIGAGDAGKTFIVVDMVKRVAQHYPVMYIAAEDASGIRVRKRAWELYHRAGKNGNFMMWNGVLPLFEETEVGGFIDEVKALDLKLIVIDTLSQSIAGADENSSKDMTIVMQHCQWIARETGAAVVVIHHTTKGGETYRGSSTLKNNTYGFLEVSKDDDLIKLECGRIKNTRPFAPRFFSLIQVDTDVADEEGQPIQSCVILPADRIFRGNQLNSSEIKMLKALLDMTDADDGAKTSDLQKTLDLTSASFYRTLKRLRNLGLADKGEKQNAPLTITNIGRQRLAEESNDPQYQEPGTAAQVTPAFEVNTKLLSLLSDSSLPDSSPDSSPEGGSEQQTTITQDSAIDSEIITTIKLLSDTLDSSGQTTIYHSPPLKGRDDESSPENKPVSGLDHDKHRIAEARQALACGDIKAAWKAAGLVRGRKDQQEIEAEIDVARGTS